MPLVDLQVVPTHKKGAYEMYLRTDRFGLDDYNNDTEGGLQTLGLARTRMSIVHRFRVYKPSRYALDLLNSTIRLAGL